MNVISVNFKTKHQKPISEKKRFNALDSKITRYLNKSKKELTTQEYSIALEGMLTLSKYKKIHNNSLKKVVAGFFEILLIG